jgi:release factor glutamine methyltransferase
MTGNTPQASSTFSPLGPDARLRDWLDALIEAFNAAGIRASQIDARLLLTHALGLSSGQLTSDPLRPVSSYEAERITNMAERRLAREPMSRIVGARKFFGRTFDVSPSILDPRRETELLIATVLDIVKAESWQDTPIQILDLGTGSGNILLTLLAELPQATGLGVDLSAEALEAARGNAVKLGVAERCRFQTANWLEGLSGAFQIVAANPPYMTDDAIAALAPEAGAYDPRLALDGGADGYGAYRSIVPDLKNVLAPGGWAVFQVGEGQAPAVENIITGHGLKTENRELSMRRDIRGVERIVSGKR